MRGCRGLVQDRGLARRAPVDLGTDGPGDELMQLVAKARSAGLDPELELRTAARRFADRVRDWERGRD